MTLCRWLFCSLFLVLSGCSTLSAVNWSAAYPWNWFSSAMVVSEQGVGQLTATTLFTEQAISEALSADYHLRRGMKAVDGKIVSYYEVLKEGKVAMTLEGNNGVMSAITIEDPEIKTVDGVQTGTPFHQLFHKAFGHCLKAEENEGRDIVCQAEGRSHISYLFSGEWHGPQTLLPADDSLQEWRVSKIIWRR